jgi:lipopolysaccharide biosynthesis glycosyltransferase
VILASRRLRLHPRWNLMNSILLFPWANDVFGASAVEEAKRNPAIRHFEGPSYAKPWHLLSEGQGRAEYFAYRRRTPWPRVRREGVTPANLVRRAVRGLAPRD